MLNFAENLDLNRVLNVHVFVALEMICRVDYKVVEFVQLCLFKRREDKQLGLVGFLSRCQVALCRWKTLKFENTLC